MSFSAKNGNLPEDIFPNTPFSQLLASCHCKSRFHSDIQLSRLPELFLQYLLLIAL